MEQLTMNVVCIGSNGATVVKQIKVEEKPKNYKVVEGAVGRVLIPKDSLDKVTKAITLGGVRLFTFKTLDEVKEEWNKYLNETSEMIQNDAIKLAEHYEFALVK